MPRYLPLLLAGASFATPVATSPMRADLPAERSVSSSAFMAIKADDGLFRLTASKAGRSIELVVDTGATQTILTSRDADRLGLPARGGEEIELLTANGSTTMRRVELVGLSVAGHRLPPLQVAVAGGGLAHSLLGQDAIGRLGRVTIERDRLEIGGERD